MKTQVWAATTLVVMAPLAVLAQESGLNAEFLIELQTDFNFDSDDPDAEITDVFPTIEAALSFGFGQGTSINSSLTFEPIIDAVDDRFLEDVGLFAEELYISHDFGVAEAFGGKFNPAFGVAWDAAPGIYGVDFAEDYEITERVGLGVNIPLGGGAQSLQLTAFQADRTFLTEALGESRDRLDIADGGVSNTSGLESFSLAFAGETGALQYNFGYQFQSADEGDVDDQQGVVAGAIYTVNDVELLGEVVFFDGFDGTSEDATFLTVGAAVPVGAFTLSGVYSLRDIDGALSDNLFTASAEYEIADGLTGSIGYRFGDEDGVDTQTLGLLVSPAARDPVGLVHKADFAGLPRAAPLLQ